MGRLLFVLPILSSIFLIQCQANALNNTTKNEKYKQPNKNLQISFDIGGNKADSPYVSRFQRTCSTQECKEMEFSDMLDSILSSESNTEDEPTKAPPKKLPHRPRPPYKIRRRKNGHILHDIVLWVERTKRAIFGFG
ncbi:LOW QUALITY PROTEIN: uncharacterized protein LOC120452404 [Drosophila santomea]|uniref:LOW QUALITY PROTEIN: uncharacterized protein LOC120452404 n=1 Tax=Drosophila santomea TaxID=129105 RepID=UPI0019536ACC|nr:LOW QUALITY PROTEIN: uncharacterized protein LOC120452404 [Drosophila santomea]